MTRALFGGGPDAFGAAGNLNAFPVFLDVALTQQATDLLKASLAADGTGVPGAAQQQVTVNDARFWLFYGPDTVTKLYAPARYVGGGLIPDPTVTPLVLTPRPETAYASAPGALLAAASAPDILAVGTITRSATGAATGFAVAWPDGATGTFIGTESTTASGAIDSYTVTHVLGGVTATYTQPALTRDAGGTVTNRPAMTVS